MTGLKRIARRQGLYKRFRYSVFYDWYARVRRPEYATGLANDRTFYRTLFNGGVKSVFDIGANVGDKSRVFGELAGHVLCVEPDPDLADILRYRFKGRRDMVVKCAAVGDAIGSASLHRKQFAGFNTLSEKWSEHSAELNVGSRDSIAVPVTTLDRLMVDHGRPDYVKIDVEGYELAVLRGLSAAIRTISFESNLPVFRDETLQAIERIKALDSNYRFNVRPMDGASFVLPSHVDASELSQFVRSAGTVTYDLFAMRPGGPPDPAGAAGLA